MNLLCPHCQKLVNVPEEHAGQDMKCPVCGGTFTAPSLPPVTVPPSVAAPPPSPVTPETVVLPPVPAVASVGAVSPDTAEPESYGLAPVPSEPRAEAPPRRPRAASRDRSPDRDSPRTETAAERPTRPSDYTHTRSLRFNPQVVSWIAPAALALLIVLLFFPWVGAYPGGYPAYTQNAWRAIWGGYSADPVAEKVLEKDKAIAETIHSNWLMFFYILLVLVALAAALAPHVMARQSLRLPPALEKVWPWHAQIALAAAGLAFLVLVLQVWSGFGLENALTAVVDHSLEKQREAAKTPEEVDRLTILRGSELGRYNLRSTAWFDLAVLANLMALLGSGLELWLRRRADRPLPRADLLW